LATTTAPTIATSSSKLTASNAFGSNELATTKEEIQALTKKFEGKVNEMAEKKSAEILEV